MPETTDDTTSETPTESASPEQSGGNPGLFVGLILLSLVVSAVLIGGFWGDKDPGTDFTPAQLDVDTEQVGPGSPVPE
ncbi:MAG TPA: hypothetical protein VI916_06415 [Acidimicrobiia bacterium]|nr:hypothetical protein [Acidimicrobiia bacterium]